MVKHERLYTVLLAVFAFGILCALASIVIARRKV